MPTSSNCIHLWRGSFVYRNTCSLCLASMMNIKDTLGEVPFLVDRLFSYFTVWGPWHYVNIYTTNNVKSCILIKQIVKICFIR